MGVYVRNGTPLDGPSLCETCSNAQVTKGYRIGEELVVCTANSPSMRVNFRVRECTGYVDKNRQSLYEMQEIAWSLLPRGPKRSAGFEQVEQVRAIGREIELTLDDENDD
jgi:hypothetical protein